MVGARKELLFSLLLDEQEENVLIDRLDKNNDRRHDVTLTNLTNKQRKKKVYMSQSSYDYDPSN